MSHSAQPTLAELRALFRLLGDLRELAHDRLAWRQRMVTGLCGLLGAKQGTVLGLDGFHPNGEMRLIDAVHGGWANPTAAAIWENQLRSGEFRNDSLLIEAQNTPEPKLSRREGEVLARLLKGESVKEAAGHLHLSARTVEDYVKALYRKHGVHSRGELLARFVKKGM